MVVQSVIKRAVPLLVTAMLVSSCSLFGPDLGRYPTVVVDSGRLQGEVVDGVPVFRGVPYAAAPVEDLRWRPPQPVEPFRKIYDATEYAPDCAQTDAEFLWFELDDVSEDCLTLNVWTAVEHRDRQAPVMVYIHGGGYTNGSGNIARINTPAMARKDVLLVTVNYRLGPFGFLTHPALSASNPDDPAGNYGLQDVVAALEWVQRNIAAFGGDPERVTVFGESAGANIVTTLLVTPAAEGLFQRAIAQSPTVGLMPDTYPERGAGGQPAGYDVGARFVERFAWKKGQPAGPELAAALRDKSTEDILDELRPTDRFMPVVDGKFLPDQVGALYAAGEMHRVPLMIGSNSWEASFGRELGGAYSPAGAGGMLTTDERVNLYPGLAGDALDDAVFGDAVVHSASRYVANQMLAYNRPVYMYYFDYVATDRRTMQPGAAHTDEVAFVFETLGKEADIRQISFDDRKVMRLMNDYWVRFARRGDPNNYGLPEWPRYDRANGPVLEIGADIEVREDLFAERMDFHIARGRLQLERAMQPVDEEPESGAAEPAADSDATE